jgi:hypothetical protein
VDAGEAVALAEGDEAQEREHRDTPAVRRKLDEAVHDLFLSLVVERARAARPGLPK